MFFQAKDKYGRRPAGFTLFEALVAMFILLVGVMGIASVFSAGMRARMVSHELVISQQLANMWADWIRYRIEADGISGASQLTVASLSAGKSGDFYEDTGSLNLPAGDPANLPTRKVSGYEGYRWEIAEVKDHVPQWIPEDGSAPKPWTKRLDDNTLINFAPGPQPLKEVTLYVYHGSRRYQFQYVFAGVGLKYNKL